MPKPQDLLFDKTKISYFHEHIIKFLLKTTKKYFLSNEKSIYRSKPQNHIFPIHQNHFSAKTQHIFSVNCKITFLLDSHNTFSTETEKLIGNNIFRPNHKNIYSQQNWKITLFAKTVKLYYIPKLVNHILLHHNGKYSFPAKIKNHLKKKIVFSTKNTFSRKGHIIVFLVKLQIQVI